MQIKENTIDYIGTFKAQSNGAKEGVLVKKTCYKAEYMMAWQNQRAKSKK